ANARHALRGKAGIVADENVIPLLFPLDATQAPRESDGGRFGVIRILRDSVHGSIGTPKKQKRVSICRVPITKKA
ncbi:hypothetical protein, partial [Paraburkholderia sp.]|uniref:hypothetical protein n=1 Tax=Paraburkholderia sp. TaxID=1926495 RepID=UPI002F3E45AB